MLEKNAQKLADTLAKELPDADVRVGLARYPSPSYYVELSGAFFGYDSMAIHSPDELDVVEEKYPSMKPTRELMRVVRKLAASVVSPDRLQAYSIGRAILGILQEAEDALCVTCKGGPVRQGDAACTARFLLSEAAEDGLCATCRYDTRCVAGKTCAGHGTYGSCYKDTSEDGVSYPHLCEKCEDAGKGVREEFIPFIPTSLDVLLAGGTE